jgi:hypothetical protein
MEIMEKINVPGVPSVSTSRLRERDGKYRIASKPPI